MTTAPALIIPRSALDALVAAYRDDDTASITLPDGGALTVRRWIDADADIGDWSDCYGRFATSSSRHNPRERPDGFDGAACRIQTRSGSIWWQPPKDVVSDRACLDAVRERVVSYYHEAWYFIGLTVTRLSAPMRGPFGGNLADTVEASLGGIESDSARDYFTIIIRDLLAEVNIRVEEEEEE